MSAKTVLRSALRVMTRTSPVRVSLRGLTSAGVLPASLWKRLPVDATFPVSLPDGTRFQYSAVGSDDIGRALYWRGLASWEPETIRVFFRLAQQAKLTFDVGANTGLFTLIACAANPTGRVVAFEPVPYVFSRLQEQICVNQFEARCMLRREAVSSEPGKTKFHIPTEEIPKSASLNVEGFRGIPGTLIDVTVTTIDRVAAETGKIDLMKIDVEGFEDKALEGMHTVLTEDRPEIVVECNPDGPYQAVERILSSYGYRFYHLHGAGPRRIEHIVPDESQHYRNYLCSPRANLLEALS